MVTFADMTPEEIAEIEALEAAPMIPKLGPSTAEGELRELLLQHLTVDQTEDLIQYVRDSTPYA